jgi:hydrogenase expression/formation protein HypC
VIVCLAIPGAIVAMDDERPDLATVDVGGVRRTVNVGLLDDEHLAVGDWILIHVGFALSKIDEAEARSALEFLESIGAAYEEELDALLATSPE